MLLAAALVLLGALQAPPAAALPAPAPPWPIRVEAFARETPDGPLRGWIARVDLADPRVSFVVTGPLERRDGEAERAEARLVATDAWAERAGVALAVNAGFFARLDGPGAPPLGWSDALPVDVVGLSRSEGRTVSPPRRGGGESAPADPALLVDETDGRCPCQARAAAAGEADLDGVEDAVAGMGPRTGRPGTLLVEDGVNRGATAQVDPARRHPRTAAGVSRDGRTLLLLVVDGRQPGWSVGATLPELAQVLLDAGAWSAVALDGGGSSAMWFREPGAAAGRVLNRPSDGRVRPVANHLGVRVAPSPSP
jgi:exopolysaccharide biosynthesis protein